MFDTISGACKKENPSIIPTYPPILAQRFARPKLLTFFVSSMKSELLKIIEKLQYLIIMMFLLKDYEALR